MNTCWLEKYRTNKSAVWIRGVLTSGEEFYHDTFDGWLSVKSKCEKFGLFLKELSLQYRSHKVDIDLTDAEAIYLIRSVMGKFGGKSKQYYTTGILKSGKVHKKMWILPELIVEKELTDDIEECFEEALLYDPEKTKNRKE
jgi:hypothetical protein